MNFMIIWEYSFKYKSSGGPWSQKKVYMEPRTSHGMSRLKFEILFDHTFYHSLSYFFIKVMIIWTYTFKFKSYGGPYIQKKVYMDPLTSLSMSRLKSKMLFYLTFPIPYPIYHGGHDDLRIFFQIQDIWRTLKSKEGKYWAVNFA